MSSKAFERYRSAVETAGELMRRELHELIGKLDLTKKNESRDALLSFAPILVEKWSNVMIAAANEYYEAERYAATHEAYHARLAPPPKREDVLEAVRYACGHLYEGGAAVG